MDWNDIWHVNFFFVLKNLCNPPLHVPSICSKLVCSKVQMKLGVQLVLDPMNSIFKQEKDLNYFDKFVPVTLQDS